MRPRSLDDVLGQAHLVGPGAPLRKLIEADRLPTSVFYGPPGTGKTTVARLAAETTKKRFVALSAPSAGVAEVRALVEEARRALGEQGRGTIVFLDELHRFSRAQQDSLLGPVEEGLIVLIGATAENPWFALSPPLASRASLWRFGALTDEAVTAILEKAVAMLGVQVASEALRLLAASVSGDARAALGTLEVAATLAEGRTLTSDHLRSARDRRMLAQGDDAHYDQASAFIKSLRGSDPDAALYWMARMLDAGEDPRFVARRMVILASEDVGLADPNALGMAVAAANALELCGMPEAELCLAEAAVYLALAPKSNSVTTGLARAKAALEGNVRPEVPTHLADPRSAGSKSTSGRQSYRYPHDDPRGYVEQDYLPPGLAGSRFYRRGSHGMEPLLAKWLEERRARHGTGEGR